MCHDGLPSNRTGTSDTHHVHDGDDDIDKDQWQDDTLEGANEEFSDETDPLDGLFLGIIIGFPETQAL